MSYAERAVIQISRPLHDRLTKIKNEQQQQLKRQVTFSEIIEQMLTKVEGFELLAAHTRMVERP